MVIFLLIMAVIAGKFYRMGGTGGGFWGNTKWRDLGVPVTVVYTVYGLGFWHWSLIISAFLLFGALTTYWTPKKAPDVLWWNWLLTGAGYGLAMLPYAFWIHHILGIASYAVTLAVATMVWSEMISDVDWEEGGRGFLIVALLPLLFVG